MQNCAANVMNDFYEKMILMCSFHNSVLNVSFTTSRNTSKHHCSITLIYDERSRLQVDLLPMTVSGQDVCKI